jgi:hypothetical protein
VVGLIEVITGLGRALSQSGLSALHPGKSNITKTNSPVARPLGRHIAETPCVEQAYTDCAVSDLQD